MASKEQVSEKIADLFGNPKAAKPPDSSGPSNLLVIVLVLMLGWLLWDRMQQGGFDREKRKDDHGQHDKKQEKEKQEDKKQDTKPVLASDGFLIFIHERKGMGSAEADMLDVAADYCVAVPGLSFRSVDVDDPSPKVKEALEFAKGKGVSPPCLIYKTLQNQYKSARAFPASLEQMLEVLK